MVLWIAYGSAYFLRKPLGVIKDDLEIGLGVSATSLGWVDTALLLPYAVISLTLGSLGDLLGPRITLAGGLLLSATATALMSACPFPRSPLSAVGLQRSRSVTVLASFVCTFVQVVF